jgi:hypothetical protein
MRFCPFAFRFKPLWRTVCAAGINRHAVVNERVLQETSNEPLDVELCRDRCEAVVEA